MTRTIATLALPVIFIVAFNVTAQEPNPKFRPAPAGVKMLNPDEFCITFKKELSADKFKAVVDRIVNTYQAKPMPSDSGLDGQAIYADLRLACLYVNEHNARQIADREETVEVVEQSGYEIRAFYGPIQPPRELQSAPRPGKFRERQHNNKFKPAPVSARGIKADQYAIEFKPQVAVEDFERELSRVLAGRNAEVLRDQHKPEMELKFAEHRVAYVRLSEKDARAIADDAAVLEVRQLYGIPIFIPQSVR